MLSVLRVFFFFERLLSFLKKLACLEDIIVFWLLGKSLDSGMAESDMNITDQTQTIEG